MPGSQRPLYWHTLASLACVVLFFIFKPAELSWWRIVLAVIFCVTLGHQFVRGILAAGRDSRRGWIEMLGTFSFVFLILAVLTIPQTVGWVLLVVGYLWPLVVKTVFR